MGLLDFLSALFGEEQQYGQSCVTLHGEKVKSHGERQIADYLYQNGIEYEYETAAKTNGWLFKEKIVVQTSIFLDILYTLNIGD